MQSAVRFGSTMVLMLVIVMVAIIAIFVLFEQQSTYWISTVAEDSMFTGGVWLLAVFLVAALACDIVLPIPSSIVAVIAATTLGFWFGAGVIWLGLMLSCCAGYFIGASSGSLVLQRFSNHEDLAKAQTLAEKIGPGALVALRGVPVLAETSVIAAGMVRYPLLSFMLICALANAGLAVAYSWTNRYRGEKTSSPKLI